MAQRFPCTKKNAQTQRAGPRAWRPTNLFYDLPHRVIREETAAKSVCRVVAKDSRFVSIYRVYFIDIVYTELNNIFFLKAVKYNCEVRELCATP